MAIRDMINEVSLIEKSSFERDTAIDNLDGIMFGDVFVAKYYGITVLLYVNKHNAHAVSVYELALKKIKQRGEDIMVICFMSNGYMKPAKKPLIVSGRNGVSVSDCWFDSCINAYGDPELLIPVNLYSPLYNKALELGYDYPKVGIIHARKVDKNINPLTRTCWHAPKKVKKAKKKKKKFWHNAKISFLTIDFIVFTCYNGIKKMEEQNMARLIKDKDIILDGTATRADKEKEAFEKLEYLELVEYICERLDKQHYYYDHHKQKNFCDRAYYSFIKDEIILVNSYEEYDQICNIVGKTYEEFDDKLYMQDYGELWFLDIEDI